MICDNPDAGISRSAVVVHFSFFFFCCFFRYFKLSSLLEHAISEFDAFKELEKELSKIKKSIADVS